MSNMSDLPRTIPAVTGDELVRPTADAAPTPVDEAKADFDSITWNDADPVTAAPDTLGTAGDTLADSRVESSFDRSRPASAYPLDR